LASSSGRFNRILTPFEIGRYIISPGRKLCGFLIEAKTGRGVFRRIMRLIEERKVDLKLVHYQSESPKGDKNIFVLIDYTECEISPEELAEEIRRSRDVVTVELIEPRIKGLIADTVSNPLTIGGIRAIITFFPAYRGLIRDVRERFGSGGAVFLYYAGFEIGKELARVARNMGRRLEVTDPLRIVRDIICSLYDAAGWGLTELIEFKSEPFYMHIRIYNSFECELGLGTGEPYSHLVRGVIAGCITEIFNIKVAVTEVKCLARGDPYCEFTVKPA